MDKQFDVANRKMTWELDKISRFEEHFSTPILIRISRTTIRFTGWIKVNKNWILFIQICRLNFKLSNKYAGRGWKVEGVEKEWKSSSGGGEKREELASPGEGGCKVILKKRRNSPLIFLPPIRFLNSFHSRPLLLHPLLVVYGARPPSRIFSASSSFLLTGCRRISATFVGAREVWGKKPAPTPFNPFQLLSYLKNTVKRGFAQRQGWEIWGRIVCSSGTTTLRRRCVA